MFLLLSALIASQAARCTHSYQINDCAEDRCEEVDGYELCTECKNDGYVPINGNCIKYDSNEHSSCRNADGTTITTQRRCGMCMDSMHLYKGGCYSCGSIYPGSLICRECAEGVCTNCTRGFFENPAASQIVDSCIRCDDTTGVAGFVGVAGCLRCYSPRLKYSNVARCHTCKLPTHMPNTMGDTCYKCQLSDCARCKAENACEICGAFKYLKGDPEPYCAARCGVGFYRVPTILHQCSRCAATCRTCEGPGEADCTSCHESEHYFLAGKNGVGKCVSCGDEDGYAGWKGIANCKSCTIPNNPGEVNCHTCEQGYLLIGGRCVANCGDYNKQCAVDSCNVTLDDKLVCSRCNEGYAPVNGICTEVPSGHGSGCVANKGSCEECGVKYFLYQGGCYDESVDAHKAVCLEAGTEEGLLGLCRRCAVGFHNARGICVHCRDPYCKACNHDADTCGVCLDGYYNPSFCTRCHSSCKTCAGEGPKQCLTCPSETYLRRLHGEIGICVDALECGYGMYADCFSKECAPCSASCATCRTLGEDKCMSCPVRTHFFDGPRKGIGRCIECGDTTNPKGIAGCRECRFEGESVVCRACNPGHTLVDGKCQPRCRDPTDCAEGSCAVGIGEYLYCRRCEPKGYAPVNGICTDITEANPSGCVTGADSDSARRCVRCGAGYFLYMGGCYKERTPVGKAVCTWAGVDGPITKTNYGPGLCNVCAKGYENQEGVCRPCTTSNCDQCRTMDQAEVCTHCTLGYVMDRAGACSIQTIGSCTVPDCAACADDGKCQRCGRGFFLTSAGTCVDNCKVIPGYYAVKNVETMVARCPPCEIPNCKVCSTDVLCAVCEDGYFSGNKGCVRCSSECTTCVGDGAEDCTSCPPGYAVTSESRVGRCERPCTPSTAGCKGCGADIDGASYCSVCSTETAFPLNGRCTEPSEEKDSVCASVVDGTCTRCVDGYFLLSGGCYQVDTYPGRTVCCAEEHGVCIKGAHGKEFGPSGVLQNCQIANCVECTTNACTRCKVGYVNVEGSCQSCASGCVACAAPNDPQMCTLCDVGYYQSTTGPAFTCTPCSASSNGIIGVAGCTHCEPPGGMVGSVLCHAFDAVPSVVPPEPSPPRRTALVAGVSVTAVLLVAGLVGFLLWWLLCRRAK